MWLLVDAVQTCPQSGQLGWPDAFAIVGVMACIFGFLGYVGGND